MLLKVDFTALGGNARKPKGLGDCPHQPNFPPTFNA